MTRKPTVNSLGDACEGRVGTRNRNRYIWYPWGTATGKCYRILRDQNYLHNLSIHLLHIPSLNSLHFISFHVLSCTFQGITLHYQTYMERRLLNIYAHQKKIRHMNFILYIEYKITSTFLCVYFKSRHKMGGMLWKFSASLLTGENVMVSFSFYSELLFFFLTKWIKDSIVHQELALPMWHYL